MAFYRSAACCSALPRALLISVSGSGVPMPWMLGCQFEAWVPSFGLAISV